MRWCLLLVCLATLGLYSSAVSAQGPFPTLNGVVADGTGRFDRAAINGAARPLQQKGAVVLVLTVLEVQGNPEGYLEDALVHYGLAQKGGRVNAELVAFFVSFSPRYAAIRYGDRFGPVLGQRVNSPDTSADQIRLTKMNPQLASGNYTAAVTGAITATVQQLELAQRRGSQPSGPPRKGGIPAAFWVFFGIVIVFILTLLLWFLRPKVLDRIRETRAARRRKQELLAAVVQAQDNVNGLLASLDLPPQAERHLNFAFLARYYGPNTNEGQEFAQLYQKAYQLLTSATNRLPSTGPGMEKEARKLDDEKLKTLMESYESIAQQLEEARGLVQRLEEAAQRVQQAQEVLNEARGEVEKLQASYEQIAQQVRLPESIQEFSDAERLLTQSQEVVDRHPLQAFDLATQALQAGRRQETQARELVQLQGSNEKNLQQLPGVIAQAEAYLEEGRKAFQQISQYNPTCWSDIVGNGSEAEGCLGLAKQLTQSASERNSPGSGQEVRQAARDIQGAQESLLRSQQLIRAIIERLENLKAYETTSRQQIDSAELAIDQGWRFIQQHDPEVSEQREQELARAQALLQRATMELETSRPNWLLIADMGRGANRLADKALADARDEQAAMERRRQRVLTVKAEAQVSVGRAKNYISFREARILRPERDFLAAAQSFFRQGEGVEAQVSQLEEEALAQALDQAASLFEEAEKRADRAYEVAIRDHGGTRPRVFGYPRQGDSGHSGDSGGSSGHGGSSGGSWGGGGSSGGEFGGGGRSGGGW